MKEPVNKKVKMSPLEKALSCIREADDRKAMDLVLLDVSKLTSFADYFIICSGRSSRQVQGIADAVRSRMRDLGVRPYGVEGEREGQWVLLDYGDVIMHIFYEPVRAFYDLESLWSDAQVVSLEAHLTARAGETG